jgi:hypothetical protein
MFEYRGFSTVTGMTVLTVEDSSALRSIVCLFSTNFHATSPARAAVIKIGVIFEFDKIFVVISFE